MFDEDAVYPITDEYNFVTGNEVFPEFTQDPVSEPTFSKPLLSISDNMFDQGTKQQEENLIYDFSDDSRNIKFANFANESYIPPPDRKVSLLGYKYNKSFSDDELATYVDKQDKKLVISLRGTVPTNFRDLVSDIGIISADTTFNISRLSSHRKLIDAALKEYPEYQLVLTGHSLAGYLVEKLASIYPKSRGIVFNPGTSLNESNLSTPQSNVIGYRTRGDPVSLGYTSIPLKTLRSKFNLDRHSILNFIDRDNSNILD